MMGDDVQHLLGAIPRVACWRLSSLPDVLSDTQIEILLASFDKDFPSGHRANAMVRCLTDLGLRTSEVVQLQLGDIDWRQGTIRISRSKAGVSTSFPCRPRRVTRSLRICGMNVHRARTAQYSYATSRPMTCRSKKTL